MPATTWACCSVGEILLDHQISPRLIARQTRLKMLANGSSRSGDKADSSSLKTLRIAIVGGGIGGVCLALGLCRHSNIELHLYEAASKFTETGAGVAIPSNAEHALMLLDPRIRDVYDGIRTTNVRPVANQTDNNIGYFSYWLGMDHRNGLMKTGHLVCESYSPTGLGSVHRARFLDGLVSLLPERVRQNVEFGHRLVEVAEATFPGRGVTLHFANGNTAGFDAVIGCDGIKSVVRKAVVGSESPEAHPTFSSKYAYRGLIPMNKARAVLGDDLARNGNHHLGYDAHVLTFPIDKGNVMNVVAVRSKPDGIWTGEWVQPVDREELGADYDDWGSNVQSIVRMMEKCEKWALFDHLPAKTYHQAGSICIMGDAAHASTPHHGAGAGMAIEDACMLSALMGEVDRPEKLEAAFETFQRARMARTQKLVQRSREQATIYEFQAPELGDNLDKIGQTLPSRPDWIFDYDIEKESNSAVLTLKSMFAQRDSSINRGHGAAS